MPHAFSPFTPNTRMRGRAVAVDRAEGILVTKRAPHQRPKREHVPCGVKGCEGVAFYTVGRTGYCEAHRAEAREAARRKYAEQW